MVFFHSCHFLNFHTSCLILFFIHSMFFSCWWECIVLLVGAHQHALYPVTPDKQPSVLLVLFALMGTSLWFRQAQHALKTLYYCDRDSPAVVYPPTHKALHNPRSPCQWALKSMKMGGCCLLFTTEKHRQDLSPSP